MLTDDLGGTEGGFMRGISVPGVVASVTAVGIGLSMLASPAQAVVPPPPVEDLAAVAAHRQVQLAWTNPSDPDFADVVVRRRVGSTPPATPSAGQPVYTGDAEQVVDTGLTNGTTYSYAVWTRSPDQTPSSTSETVVATPQVRSAVRAQLVVNDRSVTFGDPVTFSGRVVRKGSGAPVVGARVQLQRMAAGGDTWRTIEQATTGAQGRVSWRLRPQTNADFRLRHAVTPFFGEATSDVRAVSVKPKLRAALAKDWVRQFGRTKINGQVKPALRNSRVVLERKSNGRWSPIARTNPNGQGRYRFRLAGWASRDTYRYRVVVPETAKHRGVRSSPMALDVVRLVTYHIETRGKIVTSLAKFRERTDAIYADPRGWSRAYVRFQRVRSDGDFSLVLSEASYVPNFAPICDRYWSCRVGRYVIINQNRWRFGTPYFKSAGGTLREYRAMVVNHETGHWFGLGHASCTKQGAPAPVMMQQSKGLYGCKPNPWPLRWEISRVR